MRKLTAEEKSFTQELIRISQTSQDAYLANVIDGELNNTDIYLDYQTPGVHYRFDETIYNQDPNNFAFDTRNFSWRIIRYFNLLKDFEKEGMVFLYQENSPNNTRFGRLVQDRPYITKSLKDNKAIDLILDFSLKTILINQSLVDYVTRDFKSEEDIKHEQNIDLSQENLKIAKDSLDTANQSLQSSLDALTSSKRSLRAANITIWVTIAVFALGTIINICISLRNPAPVKLDSQQLNEIKKSQNELLKELKKTNNISR